MRDRDVDFLKGIAIILVMVCHASQPISAYNATIKMILSFGQLGCQIFFFLSGFLMYKKYINKNISWDVL